MAKPAAATPAAKPGVASLSAVKPGTAPATDKPSKRAKLVRIALIVVVLGAAAGAGWFFYGRDFLARSAEAKAASRAPVFMTLEPFTVNLAEEEGEHYLQAGVVYQLNDEKMVDVLKTYMPVLRNRILLLLSGKQPSDLATVEGKNKLVDELVKAARDSVPGTTPDKGVVGALFSSFVIQ